MTVRDVLARKGRAVTTLTRDQPLIEAARALADRHIGAVVIVGPGHSVVGILSERDIVFRLGSHSAAVLDEPIEAAMTTAVVTCTLDEAIGDIMRKMTLGRFRHVPVVEAGRLVGIVTLGDLVKGQLDEMARRTTALKDTPRPRPILVRH